jgi:hypothetical protein
MNKYKIGQVIIVKMDNGKLYSKKVKYEPWQLGDGTWVIGLEGVNGGYSLDRIVINACEEANMI